MDQHAIHFAVELGVFTIMPCGVKPLDLPFEGKWASPILSEVTCLTCRHMVDKIRAGA